MGNAAEEPLSKRVEALENAIGPRHLSDEQRAVLLKNLSGALGKIRISAIHPDSDAETYATEFASVFKECGWDVWGPDVRTKVGIASTE
jgi:hypothetical protein